MVRGIDSFREWFRGYEDQYAIIGGTACDLLMTGEGLDFRATRDFDLVLIVEATNAAFGRRFWEYISSFLYQRRSPLFHLAFGRRFWEYISSARYKHRNKSTGESQFYRFTNPDSSDYPAMIELFARRTDLIILPEGAVLTPLSIDQNVSSLSAILLDEDYYNLVKMGRIKLDGVTVLDAPYLIPLKAKAWMNLSDQRAAGEQVDGRNIRKHKNDVFRLTDLLVHGSEDALQVPEAVMNDMKEFTERMRMEPIDLKQLGIRNRTKDEILDELLGLYINKSHER